MRPILLHDLAYLLSLYYPNQVLVQGFAIDSRRIAPGDLFFALPGNRVDGHAFLKDAALKGAACAVVQQGYRGDCGGLPLLFVPDVLAALQELARKSLASRSSKVLAITGSLGKTTTKEFASALLRTRYRVFSSPLSYNSQVTLPLSILMANGDEECLVLEMGMSHEGNINNLISIAPPDIALITTVAVQHAVNFSDGLVGISRAKASIFSHAKTTLGLVHRDILHYDPVVSTGSCNKKTFSLTTKDADYFLEVIPNGVRVHAKGENPCDCPLNLPIRVHHHNFLAAVALARNLDVPWSSICEVAPTLKLPPMRFEPIEKQGILFINDAYNANPDSMIAALENLPKPQPGGKIIAVLSEMDALGDYTEQGHKRVAEAAIQYADYLFCLGSRCETMRSVWKSAQKPMELFPTHVDLRIALKAMAQPGDVVLLKGARSYALEQLLQYW